jgi:hypothetical protein
MFWNENLEYPQGHNKTYSMEQLICPFKVIHFLSPSVRMIFPSSTYSIQR